MRKDETVDIYLLHRAGPARYTDEGLGALSAESPIRPSKNALNVNPLLKGLFDFSRQTV
jgi:hypothetical protein